MEDRRILYLLNKQAQATYTARELAELEDWYEKLGTGQPLLRGINEQELAMEMLRQFRKNTGKPYVPVRKLATVKIKYWLAAAASVLLLLLAGSFFLFNKKRAVLPQEVTFIQPAAPATFIRQVTLPDGSRVVLKPNSTLQFPPQFAGPTRTVLLNGEAYFDVVHSPARPFIIRTGEVTTTVLGTAFNIAAWPGQPTVAVTVTRGKVRVSNRQKTLALLTADQQIIYDLTTAVAAQHPKAEPVTGWLKSGMSFTDQPMRTIIPVLQNRFQQSISFSNPALQNCMVTASFDGTETLDQVLDVLCLTINARYQPQTGGYLLTGEGCQ